MKSAFWRTLAIAAIVAMPTLADANDATVGSEAATSAMAGSTLNNTTALFNAWPHLVTMYGSGAELSTSNFSTAMNAGMGKVWWEAYDELWLNFNVGRRDLGTQSANFLWGGPVTGGFTLSGFGDQLGGFNAITNPWINLGIAKPGAGGSAWSANVFLAGESFEDETDAVTNEESATGYGALVSWGNGDGLHVSGEFAMLTETDEPDTDGGNELEGDALSFALNGRYDTDLYIYQGSFVYATGTEQVDGAEVTDEDTTFLGFLASAGRFLKNEVDGQTSAEFVFAYTSNTFDNGTAEVTTSAMVIPGVRVSAWEKISDTFGLMGGVQSVYQISSTDDQSSSSGLDYYWTLGTFAQFTENVRVDFEFSPGALNNVLSLGNQEELVAYLGATVGLN